MTSASALMQPKYLTAAALAWTVGSASKPDPHKIPVVDSDEDTEILDSIPEIEEDPVRKKHVVPVVVKPLKATVNSPSVVSSSPTQAKVSAAAMRQLESRRRVRSAMEQHHHQHNRNNKKEPTKAHISSGASVSSVRTSPKATVNNPKTATTSSCSPSTAHISGDAAIRTPPPAHSSKQAGGASVAGTPPSVIDIRPIHFKVKSKTTGTVLRFQCVPTFYNVNQNIVDRLRRGACSKSVWSSATNMLSSSLDYAAAAPVNIQFQDAEGDWCTLTNDDDLQDALEASMARKDTMVRLEVEEPGAVTRVWQSISTQFGW